MTTQNGPAAVDPVDPIVWIDCEMTGLDLEIDEDLAVLGLNALGGHVNQAHVVSYEGPVGVVVGVAQCIDEIQELLDRDTPALLGPDPDDGIEHLQRCTEFGHRGGDRRAGAHRCHRTLIGRDHGSASSPRG